MKIIQRKVNGLIPYINNTRTHSDEQIQQIASSIKEFGFTNPILIDEKGGIIAGHGRVMGAKLLQMDEVPTITLKGLTDAQIKAYIIADNKLALNAGWDDELLKLEIEALQEMDFDIDLLGFSLEELNDLDIGINDLDLDTDKADDVPELEENPIIKLGDLIELGHNYQHRVLCGDSTSEEDVTRLMDGKKADMVFTDPPYNVNYGNIKHDKFKQREIQNDNMTKEDFRKFCQKFVEQLDKWCEGILYVWAGTGADSRIMFTVLDEMLHCSTTIVWNKDRFTLGRGKYQNKWESCWFGWGSKGSGKNFTNDRKITNVWDFKRPSSSELHPTMKPIELVEYGVFHASKTKDIVLDLFGGSGSTMIGCENMTRHSRLMELEEKYAQVIVQRYVDYTSNPMIKINGVKVDWNEYKEEHS